jgi:hypothetical protein
VGLSYGKGHLPVRLPGEARATIIRKTPLPKIADPRELNIVIDEDRDLVRVTFGEVIASISLRSISCARRRRSRCRAGSRGPYVVPFCAAV